MMRKMPAVSRVFVALMLIACAAPRGVDGDYMTIDRAEDAARAFALHHNPHLRVSPVDPDAHRHLGADATQGVTLRPAHGITSTDLEHGAATLASWPTADHSPCVTPDTLNSTLRALRPNDHEHGEMLVDGFAAHRWVLRNALLGGDSSEDSLAAEDIADYHDTLIVAQLFAIARRRAEHADAGGAPRGPQLSTLECTSHHLCGIADTVHALLTGDSGFVSPPLRHPTLAALRGWKLRADNVTVGEQAAFADVPFDPKLQAMHRALLVPRAIEYARSQLTARADRVAKAILDLDVYVDGRLSGRGGTVRLGDPMPFRRSLSETEHDELLVRRIFEEVVVAHAVSPRAANVADAKHTPARAFCSFSVAVAPVCAAANAELRFEASALKLVATKPISKCEAIIMCPTPALGAMEAALLRGVFADPATAERQLRVPARHCSDKRFVEHDDRREEAVAQRFARRDRRKKKRKQQRQNEQEQPHDDDPHGAEAVHERAVRASRAFAFDVHMEVAPTPVARARGCLSAPLVVRGKDGAPHPLLRDCMVIQQLPVEMQMSYAERATGADIGARADYERFLASWLADVVASNYSAPFLRRRTRIDIPDDDLVAKPQRVVPRWCERPESEREPGTTPVCAFLRGAATYLVAARHAFGVAATAALRRAETLEADMDRLTADVSKLQLEQERSMAPAERGARKGGKFDCGAVWCAGMGGLVPDRPASPSEANTADGGGAETTVDE